MTIPENDTRAAGRARRSSGGAVFDPFAVLGLPPRFDVDVNAVQRAVLKRLAQVHPDRQRNDPAALAQAERESARLNQAKAILCDDEKRADVLVLLLGGPNREDEKSLPDGFLMDMLEVREQMEEALSTGDDERLAELERWVREKRREYVEKVAGLFTKLEDGGDQESPLREIRLLLNGWRYIERMIEQIGEGGQG